MASLPRFPGFRIALSNVAIPPVAFDLMPEAPANPQAGLFRLPPELVMQVLASCPDFSTLWSLIRASRSLWALFDANAWAIVEGVLQQGVPLPLAGILRATARAHLGTLCGGDPDPAVNHLVWAESPPFRRHEVPTGLLRNIVRLAHDIHVLAHLYLEERLQRCATMPREPPRWALAPPSANEVFRVEMCLWRAQLISPFAWDWSLPAEDLSIVNTLHQSVVFSQQMPDPEPMARERHGSIWALLRRCTCCGSMIATKDQPHLFSVIDTPSWAFYGRLLASVWSFPSHDKITGIRQHMRSFGLAFWDQERMVALGFPVRKESSDYRDYTTNFGRLYTEDEFRNLAISSRRHRRDSAEDLARETWALSHMQDYRCGVTD